MLRVIDGEAWPSLSEIALIGIPCLIRKEAWECLSAWGDTDLTLAFSQYVFKDRFNVTDDSVVKIYFLSR